jgi:HEAT repeat protein
MFDDPLLALWRVSLLFSLISILVLAALIVMRFVTSVGARKREEAQRNLTRLLIEISADNAPDVPGMTKLIRNRRLTAQALVEFSTLIRGDELQQALHRLKEAGLGRQLRGLIHHSNREVRLVVIEALGLLMDDLTEAALQKMVLHGPSLREVVTAARTLQSAGRGLKADTLLSGLKFRRGEAPVELGVVLSELASTAPLTLCEALTNRDIDPSIKLQIITALGAAGRYETLDVLAELAIDGDTAQRAAAVSALGRLGHPAARSALAQALDDSEAQVREEAAEAVGLILLDDLRPKLSALVSDSEWPVRFHAARALLRFGDAGRDDLMKVAHAHERSKAGRTAALVLAEGA